MSAWISVNDKLPSDFGNYLVWTSPLDSVMDIETMQIATFFNGDNEFDVDEQARAVTHWMPLPEPPK